MEHRNLSANAQAFLAKNPTLIGIVNGAYFYEHPQHGDESPLLMITVEGKLKRSVWFELPDYTEM